MTKQRLALPLILLGLLAACGETAGRYLIEAPAVPQETRVRVATIEVRDVTLPSYAAESEIMVQTEDGSLRPVPQSVWADDPIRAVTFAVASGIDAGSTATAIPEPWPLDEPPQVRVEVRIERMLARLNGQFELSGQFAIASPDAVVRERIRRFDILKPIPGEGARAVSAATGAALLDLSQRIIAQLRR